MLSHINADRTGDNIIVVCIIRRELIFYGSVSDFIGSHGQSTGNRFIRVGKDDISNCSVAGNR